MRSELDGAWHVRMVDGLGNRSVFGMLPDVSRVMLNKVIGAVSRTGTTQEGNSKWTVSFQSDHRQYRTRPNAQVNSVMHWSMAGSIVHVALDVDDQIIQIVDGLCDLELVRVPNAEIEEYRV